MKDYLLGVFRVDSREISSLNGIRGIAIFMLFYVHMYRTVMAMIPDKSEYLHNFLNNGSASIDMFFVLSGFLISGPLMVELRKTGTLNLKMFFTKRSLRIFPPYFIFLAIQYFILYPRMIKANPEYAKALDWIWNDIFYISNYFTGTLFQGWSLSLEEQFYVVFPIFLLLLFRKMPEKWKLSSLVAIPLIPLLYRLYFVLGVIQNAPQPEQVHLYNKYVYYPFHGHIDSIFYGIILAYIFNNRKDWIDWLYASKSRRMSLNAFFWLVILGYSVFVDEYSSTVLGEVIRFPVFSIAWGMVLLLTMREGSFSNKILSFKFWSPFAKLSYCAYIIHVVVMMPLMGKFLPKIPHQKDIFLWFIPVGLGIFLVSYLYHLFAERPFMILKDQIVKRSKQKTREMASLHMSLEGVKPTE